MKRVHIIPGLPSDPDPGDGGIRQVVRAQHRLLPDFGWEHTNHAAEADVIACHVEIPSSYLALYPDKPFITHTHGLYWSPDYVWEMWCYETNRKVMEAVRAADGVTAVSEWTAQALRRNSLRDIRVVYHGVDLDEWTPSKEHGTYALWNKTRTDPICNPTPVNEVAALLPGVPFVSTFGDDTLPNLSTTGALPYDEAKEFVRRAGCYLATTRETFGIGTLEAMASGIPVVGFSWGGQLEIIEHGVDGWLVPPGDIEGLAKGIMWARDNRDEIGARAREKAAMFPLEESAKQYAALYDEVLERRSGKRPKVSVIVPVYDMGDYLDETLRSVSEQTLQSMECVIVDDASPDPRDREIAARWAKNDPRFRIVTHETNRYLAAARNTGIAEARGEYIFPLDADDQITPRTLEVLAGALDGDRGIQTAYGNVLFVEEDGKTPKVYEDAKKRGLTDGHSGWPVSFRLDWQLRGPGQLLPYSSMYRREVWEAVGGYRTRAMSSEDCEFWLRTTSYGFLPSMVTNIDTLIYRVRGDSMSSSGGVGWEEHRRWFPWVESPDLLPGAAVREMPIEKVQMPAYDPPLVAVVIPVGPDHAGLVQDAVDSVEAQTWRMWECIVVNDSGASLPKMQPWVRIIEPDKGKRFGGVAAARNAGIRAAHAPTFLPLDADDYLQPHALQMMVDAHLEREDRPIVYSDFWQDTGDDGSWNVHQCDDYDPNLVLGRKRVFMGEEREGMLHSVTALTPVHIWREVGGYDEDLPAWEDWAFAIAAAAKGYCERRVAAPLFSYRKHTGLRRDENYKNKEESRAGMMAKDFGVPRGEKLLACAKCPGGAGTTYLQMQQSGPHMNNPPEGAVLVEYTGDKAGTISFRGQRIANGPRPNYGFSASHRINWVNGVDAEMFLSRNDFKRAHTPDSVPETTAVPAIVAARTPVQGNGTEPASEPEPAPAPTPPAPAPAPAPENACDEHSDGCPEGSHGEVPAVDEDRLKALMAVQRAALNAEAERAGIANPGDLPNKEAVARAVIEAEKIKAEMAPA